jgi:hypothetical protein
MEPGWAVLPPQPGGFEGLIPPVLPEEVLTPDFALRREVHDRSYTVNTARAALAFPLRQNRIATNRTLNVTVGSVRRGVVTESDATSLAVSRLRSLAMPEEGLEPPTRRCRQ